MNASIRLTNSLLACLLWLGVPGAAGVVAQSDIDREWSAMVEDLERAVVLGDVHAIDRARDRGHQLLAEPSTVRQQARVRYLIAYANWRLLGAGTSLDGNRRDTLADEAAGLLLDNIAARDADPEAHALLGGVYGMKIGSSAWRGMTFGRQAARAFQKAREIDDRNPRLLLLEGIDAFHRPPMFGGGLDRAAQRFRSAIAFYETQPPDLPWPSWGLPDAHAWLGRTLAERGNRNAAREQYESALRLEPDYALVRYVLMPRIDK